MPSPQPQHDLPALLEHAAYAPIENAGWIRVTGDDRVRWLNGMVTNAIAALTRGQGCYNFFLSAQGRIQGDATAFLLENCILLETERARIPGLMAMLDRFIIMDDVELADVSEEYHGILAAGPEAAAVLAGVGLAETVAELQTDPAAVALRFTSPTRPMDGFLLRAHSPLVPCFELWGGLDFVGEFSRGLAVSGVVAASHAALEQLRILSGMPLFGVDIRDKDLPQETAQTRALHFSKGCYLGQEIVERIHSRGAVHRTFRGFILSGEAPSPGTPLSIPDNPGKSGEITSTTYVSLSSGAVQLGLGYVRRDALASALSYAGGSATPVTLPFQLASQ